MMDQAQIGRNPLARVQESRSDRRRRDEAIVRVRRDDRITLISSEFCAAILCFLQMASTLGPIVPAGTAMLTVALIFLGRHRASRWKALLPFLSLPLLAVISTIWSPSPAITGWYSTQFLLTFVAILAIAAAISARPFMRVLLWGSLLATGVSIGVGTMGPSDKGAVLIGLGGSKNAMASMAYLLFVAAGAVLLDSTQPKSVRSIAFFGVPMGIYVLSITHASGEIVIAIAAPLITIALLLIRSLPQIAKIPLFVLALFCVSPFLLFGGDVVDSATDQTLKLLEKDRTLTGRTYIWDLAKSQIRESPILGKGYRYFWMSYQPDAVGALHSQNVINPGAFNFHNTYYEMGADLGIIGIAVGVLTMVASLVLCATLCIFGRDAFWVFATVFTMTMLIRSFGETLFQAFSIYGPLIFAFGGYGLIEARYGDGIVVPNPERWQRRYR